MSVSSVTNQVIQTAQTDSSVTTTTTTTVTSNDPRVLTQQQTKVENQITQLQNQHGSPQDIDSLKQTLQAIQLRIRQAAENRPAAAQAAEAPGGSAAKGLDVKA